MKKIALVLVLLVVVAIAATLLRPPSGEHKGPPVSGLPWQIEMLPGGNSRVFGLTLGASTIGDARQRFGSDMEIAVMAAKGEDGTVEAYYGKVTTGVVTGRMILTAVFDRATVDGMRQRATRSEYTESGARKFELVPSDLTQAYAAPIAGITYIPSASLNAEIARNLFGEPGERIRVSEHVEHFLYPGKGLALTLDDAGKEVLQYVPPQHFAALRKALEAKKVLPTQ